MWNIHFVMNNRQNQRGEDLSVLPTEQCEYFVSDLRGLDINAGANFFLPKKKENHSGVMKGEFVSRRHCGGLSLHGGEITELQNLSNCFELPSGISFTFLFEGAIDFALAGKKYRMSEMQEPHGLSCSSIILSDPEVLTKYMSKNRKICKLNLFVERSWLEARCNSREDTLQLSRLFQQHAVVTSWVPTKDMVALARSLLIQQNSESLIDKIQGECQAMELLALCINGLSEHLSTRTDDSISMPLGTIERQLKEKIDCCLTECFTLESIAAALSMSVSTLQRKFKAAFGVTVIDYVRQRRLGIVRSAMLDQGLSVGEAAYLAGYKYPSNFVAAFKKHYGVTPSEFTKSHA
jgi:AraC-like DNA-binding protein